MPGKGNFAALSPEAAARRRLELAERLRQTAAELRSLGATEAELRAWVSEGGEEN